MKPPPATNSGLESKGETYKFPTARFTCVELERSSEHTKVVASTRRREFTRLTHAQARENEAEHVR